MKWAHNGGILPSNRGFYPYLGVNSPNIEVIPLEIGAVPLYKGEFTITKGNFPYAGEIPL